MSTHHRTNKSYSLYQKKVNTLLLYLHDVRSGIYNLYVLFAAPDSEIRQTPFTSGLFQNRVIWKHVEDGNTFFIAQLPMYIVLSLKRWSVKSCLIFVTSLYLFPNSPFISKYSFFNYFLHSFITDLVLQNEGHDRMFNSPASYFVGLRITS